MADEKQKTFEERAEEGNDSSGDAGAGQVQAQFDAINEKGYVGEVTDPTPNENYSLEGGADPKTGKTGDTPETDPELAVKADALARGLEDRFAQNPQDAEGARKRNAELESRRVGIREGAGTSTSTSKSADKSEKTSGK
jgi:hypothetical protein